MGEITFKSAGVSTREIDLSAPTVRGPTGVPAGVIGTAERGPAFVPLTFGSANDFKLAFGEARDNDEQAYGFVAVSQWLANAGSCTYLRVLGIGDGKKRSASTGNVTNAGFVVGSKQIQDNGLVGDNIYANAGVGSVEGRTYFLGCFMSESAGSTIFSEAGMQANQIMTSARSAFEITQHCTGTVIIEDSFGTKKAYHFASGTDGTATVAYDAKGPEIQVPAGVQIDTKSGRAATVIAAAFITQMKSSAGHNGTIDGSSGDTAIGVYAQLTQSAGSGVAGNTSLTYLIPTASAGIIGLGTDKTAVIGPVSGPNGGDSAFASGSIKGAPASVLRGVILAPSGVVIHLGSKDQTAPSATLTARASDVSGMGRKGAITGSVDLKGGNQEFVMVLNGHKGSTNYPNLVSASFDPTSPLHISKVLNTKASRIEEAGHLLYAHFDVHPNLAIITGSGAVHHAAGKTEQNAAFILTSSVARVGKGSAAVSSTVPVYESFEDRFTTPKTPFVTSQNFGASPYNLFRLHSVDDGAYASGKRGYKITVKNIIPGTETSPHGTFSIQIRKITDTDDAPQVLKTFAGLSLDPGSTTYIAKVIGDQQVKYDFDSNKESQKLIIDGTHPVRNNYVRVEMSEAMKKKEVPDEALPFGFRGPDHLVTSGALLSTISGTGVTHVAPARSVMPPPIPYRKNVTLGTGASMETKSYFAWGFQTERIEQIADPNAPAPVAGSTSVNPTAFDLGIKAFLQHFPTHRKDATNFMVGSNPGAADVNGAVLDCDKFQNARFTLENIKVRTGSFAETKNKAHPDYWLSASYVRDGNISIDNTAKTRAFAVEDLDINGNRKYIKFTVPMQGGFDGSDIFNIEKSRLSNTAAKREMDDSTNQGGVEGSTVSAYRKAVEIMGDTSGVDIKVLATPGIRHTSVTDYAINEMESRFDALYIMDIEERDEFNTVVTSSLQTPHVSNTVTAFKNRGLDSSFAAAYFPDVTVIHPESHAQIDVPPSCVVLGAYSLNDKVGHPWFAPAGFSRGTVSQTANGAFEQASAGLLLARENLDDLYDADINPIVSYPNTGLAVWGQKTLLAGASALDRVNVRRLLIDVRRSVRNIANTLLFEPNRSETLEKFSNLVNPILQNIQDQQGLDRFKVIIDASTTTQADVENNTLRGKIYLQPTRTVEFVALDFEVTNAGGEL